MALERHTLYFRQYWNLRTHFEGIVCADILIVPGKKCG